MYRSLIKVTYERECLSFSFTDEVEIITVLHQSGRTTHPDVGPDVVGLAVSLQVPLDLLMGQEAVQLGLKGEIREHHHLLGQVGSVRKSEPLSWSDCANISCRQKSNDPLHT